MTADQRHMLLSLASEMGVSHGRINACAAIMAALGEIVRLKAERDAIIRAYIAHKPAFFIRDHTISETWQVVVPVRPELDRLGVDFQYHATETAAINAIRRAAGLKEPPNEYALSGVRPGRDHVVSRGLPGRASYTGQRLGDCQRSALRHRLRQKRHRPRRRRPLVLSP